VSANSEKFLAGMDLASVYFCNNKNQWDLPRLEALGNNPTAMKIKYSV
jgi:hypothetical protein